MISFVALILIIFVYIIPLNIPIYNLSNYMSISILEAVYNEGFTETSNILLTSIIYSVLIVIIFLIISSALYLLQRRYVIERGENLYRKISDEISKHNKGLNKLNFYGIIIIAILTIAMIIMRVVDIRAYILGILLVAFILKQDIKINSNNIDVEAVKNKKEMKELAKYQKINSRNNGNEVLKDKSEKPDKSRLLVMNGKTEEANLEQELIDNNINIEDTIAGKEATKLIEPNYNISLNLKSNEISKEEQSKEELQNIIAKIKSTNYKPNLRINSKEEIKELNSTVLNDENQYGINNTIEESYKGKIEDTINNDERLDNFGVDENDIVSTYSNMNKKFIVNRPIIKKAIRVISDKRHTNINLKIKEDEKFKYKTLKWNCKLDSDNKNEPISFEAKFRLNDKTKVTNTNGIIYEKSIDEFGTQIKYICDKKELNIKEKIEVVLALVSSFNRDNNRKTLFSPRQVIQEECGSGVELAICASSILKSMDLDVEEINTKDHHGNRIVDLAVEGADSESEGIFYSKYGKKYYYCRLLDRDKFTVGPISSKDS